jgi:hypothetical protein
VNITKATKECMFIPGSVATVVKGVVVLLFMVQARSSPSAEYSGLYSPRQPHRLVSTQSELGSFLQVGSHTRTEAGFKSSGQPPARKDQKHTWV